jgi:hypothetical protein
MNFHDVRQISPRKLAVMCFTACLIAGGCGQPKSANPNGNSGSQGAPQLAVSIEPSDAQVVNPGESVSITAAVDSDGSNQGVTWALIPPSGVGVLSDTTATSAAFHAPANVPFTTNVTVTATSIADPKRFAALTINLNAPVRASTSTRESVTQTNPSGGRFILPPQASRPN